MHDSPDRLAEGRNMAAKPPDMPDADFGNLFLEHQERLIRIVRVRMDPRLRGRVDAGDVTQEVFVEAMSRYAEFAEGEPVPLFVWLRFLTVQKLAQFHRRHLGVQARDASREISLYRGQRCEASSAILAEQLIGNLTTPSQAAVREETKLQLEEALNSMDGMDREVLALRHFEQLSNVEAAQVLDISASAASNRYVRAIKRLKDILGQ